MKSGYDQYFKNAQQVARNQSGPLPRLKLDSSPEELEQKIRRKMQSRPTKPNKKKPSASWKAILLSFLGLVTVLWAFENLDQIEKYAHRIEFRLTGQAMAETAESKPSEAKSKEVEKKVEPVNTESDEGTNSAKIDELDHMQKLSVRKKELDAREEELNRMESELQVQKMELEKRIKELEDMRGKISSVLEDRVKGDEQKVETLVQVYTNMKAPQAAKVFETMDEDLAVDILSRMKKKNAADIMNLLKPEKAQLFSEMFAGYKRRTPASR
jgi:flagellar motility protein MotE (MotC chaperone)